MIASGPAYPDRSTNREALAIVQKYGLVIPKKWKSCCVLSLCFAHQRDHQGDGEVRQFVSRMEKTCQELGYQPMVLTASLSCAPGRP